MVHANGVLVEHIKECYNHQLCPACWMLVAWMCEEDRAITDHAAMMGTWWCETCSAVTSDIAMWWMLMSWLCQHSAHDLALCATVDVNVLMMWNIQRSIQIYRRFKRTLIHYDIDTEYANVRGNPLHQATKRHLNNTTVIRLKMMKN